MESTSLSSDVFGIWIKHLIDCAKHAESTAIPFTDLFGVKAFSYSMKCKEDTIRDRMNSEGIKSVPIKGVTEATYHAADIAKVFGSG